MCDGNFMSFLIQALFQVAIQIGLFLNEENFHGGILLIKVFQQIKILQAD
jgi:hypothetical protein